MKLGLKGVYGGFSRFVRYFPARLLHGVLDQLSYCLHFCPSVKSGLGAASSLLVMFGPGYVADLAMF